MAAPPKSQFSPDTPIDRPDQDELGRFGLAQQIADQVLGIPSSEGFVIGLLGPWGSGKTSILNLVSGLLTKDSADKVLVVRFNPWMFSATEQLITRFFAELSVTLKVRDAAWAKTLGALLEGYGQLLEPMTFIPVVGTPAGLLGKVMRGAGGFLGKRDKTASMEAKRNELRTALAKSPKRLLFVLDDIDRLNDAEIRDIMRLVRLVGDFPNCIYLLAFDRGRVEAALGEQVGGDGRAYLEKILQFVNEVPPARRSDLANILTRGIQEAAEAGPTGPFDHELWQNVFALGMFPLFKKMRDIRRYLNGLRLTLRTIGEEVAVVDAIALEAIRILRPDVFALIPDSVEALTTTSSDYDRPANDEHKRQLEDILTTAGDDRNAVEQLLTRLFPACQQHLKNTQHGSAFIKQWSKARRVAHERMLRFYLERSYPKDTISNQTVASFYDSLGDEQKLSELLDPLSAGELEHVLERLEDFEEDYPIESVEPASAVILRQLYKMSDDRSLFFFGFSAETKVTRVIYRLLKRVPEETIREQITQQLFDRSDLTLRAKRLLLLIVGHEPNAGHRFVSRVKAEELERALAEEIVNATESVLAKEGDLVRLVVWVEKHGIEGSLDRLHKKLVNDYVFLNLLVSSASESQSQIIGDVAVQKERVLAWETLTKYLGEDVLKQEIEQLRGIDDEGRTQDIREVLELASKYSSGWRPKNRFGEGE